MPVIDCEECGERMKKDLQFDENPTSTVFSVILFSGGIVISLFGYGAIIGIPMIIIALFLGSTGVKIWKCRKCGHTLKRT